MMGSKLWRSAGWASLLVWVACGGRTSQTLDDDGQTPTGGAGPSTGGIANPSSGSGGRSTSGGGLAFGGELASGGSLLEGGIGGAVWDWDVPWLAAGAPGTFSEHQLLGSCGYESELGAVTDCKEVYDLESEFGASCTKGFLEPSRYSWSSDPCPRAGVLGVCVHAETLFVHYYYHESVYPSPLVEDCESDAGEFYEP